MLTSGMKRRIAAALSIGVITAFLCWLSHRHPSPNDFLWALGAAHDLIAGHDPYARALSPNLVPYPLPAAVLAMTCSWAGSLASALFFGLSSALLAFGLTRSGYNRLLIFLAYPYWMAMETVQWSPLMMAGALLPWLFPVLLAKPQLGVPIALTHWNRRAIISCIALAALTLLLQPNWPLRWLSQIGSFQNYVPLFVLPGPALLLALWLRSDPDSHLLLLASLAPQHWFYDSFVLWLIPKGTWEILATVCWSWGTVLWWPSRPASHYSPAFGSIAVVWTFFPMLSILLMRKVRSATKPIARTVGEPERDTAEAANAERIDRLGAKIPA